MLRILKTAVERDGGVPHDQVMRCVVVGATGYIGGRLVPELLAAGHDVRVVARSPEKLAEHPWRLQVDVVKADVTKPGDVSSALAGQQVCYYLVHSLVSRDFTSVDRRAAQQVAAAARESGVERLVYLGGIVPDEDHLSAHLASRAEVGQILLASGVPTVALQAAVILGSGSASFEMLRYLTERLPMMVSPRWVDQRVQPIAVRDVIYYLVRSAELPFSVHGAFDIGGPEVLTYRQMMQRYAEAAGLRHRLIIPVPVLTPWLSAQWVNLVTPVPKAIAVPLIESLIHDVVCHDHRIAAYIPDPPDGLTGYDRAVTLALTRIRGAEVPTRWSDAATPSAPSEPFPSDPEWSGGTVYEDVREQACAAPPLVLWEVIEAIGGERGWYSFPLAWSFRGWLDRVVGGVGLRRGRRDPQRLRPGEALDWWRVEDVRRGELLRLRAEMKLPGFGWLELRVAPGDNGGSIYSQRALFEPRGLGGQLYWWSVAPFHALVFGGMARNIARSAERLHAG
jgi:uncharacterized protein YbjT (DUF2867 family)